MLCLTGIVLKKGERVCYFFIWYKSFTISTLAKIESFDLWALARTQNAFLMHKKIIKFKGFGYG
jgi:hypothetical protein